MNGFQGYDQWKTASPYDDYDDEHCVYCGTELPDDVTELSVADDDAVTDGFCTAKCQSAFENNGGQVSDRYGLPHPTDEQFKQIKALCEHLNEWRQNHRPEPVTLEEVSECFPGGDFKWEEDDPGDAHVYCCGEKDCPTQWHEAFYTTTIERKDGKLTIEVSDGDIDGNWDINCGWEDCEDWDSSGVGYHFGEYQLLEYFAGWLAYWLDAAETGKDPCNQTMTRPQKPREWVAFCIKAAQDNANALPIGGD